MVAPGIYREYVNPVHAGTEEERITYRSTEPLGAVITGAEQLKNWKPYEGNVWVCRIPNSIFGGYNPYTTIIFGDWFLSKAQRHTGCVYLNDRAMYETLLLLHFRTACKKEINARVEEASDVKAELVEKDGKYYLQTNIYDFLKGFENRMIHTDILGKAFEPEEKFENPDGTPIQLDSDYFGEHRGVQVIPGPFTNPESLKKPLF